jgi:hypothetical protein
MEARSRHAGGVILSQRSPDREIMASATYQLFRRAILRRQQITCTYQGCYRELCPHVLGHTAGHEMALTYQFGGQSNSGLPPEGEWRCLDLTQVQQARPRDGPWHTGHRHSLKQTCVDIVDLDANA